jgi:hypothetical protein
MEDNLWIRVENGQVVEGHHPAYESNIIAAFPELSDDLTTHFAPVDLTPYPELAYNEIALGPTYVWVGDRVTNVYTVRTLTDEELAQRDTTAG